MAEALFNAAAPPGWRAGSAGTEPAAAVRPEAVAVMAEAGLDISAEHPKALAEVLGAEVALVVGLCAEEVCPVVPGAVMEHWPLPNPAGRDIAFFREIRDELERRVSDLITRLQTA
jgi:protein-tyrosine-phosphatase